MRHHTATLIASVFAITLHSSPALAATIGNNASSQEASTTMAAMPQRGLTMSEVERYYGKPQKKDAPVGKPPISRWHYDGFIVVFDQNYVIHSIASAD